MNRIALILLTSIALLSCGETKFTISNNMPNISWRAVECDGYEIWIDNAVVDTVPSDQNFYTTFPLSFGEHSWEVMGIVGSSKKSIKKGAFVVDDAPISEIPTGSQLLRYGWNVRSSIEVDMEGGELSEGKGVLNGWAKTTLPATVLTALVRNNLYPNPYIGMNNMLIPDINDDYNREYDLLKHSHIKGHNPWQAPYWYYTQFKVDSELRRKHIYLNFGEINYKAEVWLNGKQIADTVQMEGSERQFRFNIGDIINESGDNHLAVAIYPPVPYGRPEVEPLTPFSNPGQNMGDGKLAMLYTKWDCLGWDWQPAIRDRDMGITEDVWLEFTDDIVINDLYLSSHFDRDTAIMTSAVVTNYSDKRKEGVLKLSIKGDDNREYIIEEEFSVEPFGSRAFECSQSIENPKLWWPHQYGEPHLYDVSLSAVTQSGDEARVDDKVGIRKVETYIGESSRIYKINGERVYIKGGNWVLDMMLNWTSSRYEKEILLARNANQNLLRVWGPTGVPPKAFYRAADEHGVLLWQDFLNDYWGTFRNRPEYRPEKELYREITTGIAKRYRNHPSLIIWCGGNEGVNPREEMIVDEILANHDSRTTRHYLKESDGDGLHGGGPYHTIEPSRYFTHPKLTGFSSEIGPSGVPEVESMQKFMPKLGEGERGEIYPIDGVWAYHDANNWPEDDLRKFSSYDSVLRNYYGREIGSAPQYVNRAQALNYDVYRASIESINRQLWDSSTGILLWKANSSWPSMVWQIYDWYLQSHSGYYGAKSASEPVHIQLNLDDNSISAINSTPDNHGTVSAKVEIYNKSGEELFSDEERLSLGANSVVSPTISIPNIDELHFTKLILVNGVDEILSENIYCQSPNNDYRSLSDLEADVELSYREIESDNGVKLYKVVVRNNGPEVAFMVRLRCVDRESNSEIVPSYWDSNYFTLMPNESRETTLWFFKEDSMGDIEIEQSIYSQRERE